MDSRDGAGKGATLGVPPTTEDSDPHLAPLRPGRALAVAVVVALAVTLAVVPAAIGLGMIPARFDQLAGGLAILVAILATTKLPTTLWALAVRLLAWHE